MIRSVIALDVIGVGLNLSALLLGSAKKFAPHITLRGRFVASDRLHRELPSILKRVSAALPKRIKFSQTTTIDPELIWLENLPSDEGHSELLKTHLMLHEALNSANLVVQDETPTGYSTYGFRPHLTLAWNTKSTEEQTQLGKITVLPQALSVYQYKRTPLIDAVYRQIIIDLGSPDILQE